MYKSHFLIVSKPKPCGGAYIYVYIYVVSPNFDAQTDSLAENLGFRFRD